MEEYLENMKSLRSYMNDLEEDAAKRSAEEQQQRTAIDAHDADIALVRAQSKQASEEAEQLATARAQVCVEMLEKQGRIATLDVECATLKQTLELLHQEIASTSAKLNEKRLFYTKTTETLTVKLQEQRVHFCLFEWFGSLKNKSTTMELHVVTSQCKQTFIEGERHGTFNSEGSLDQLGSDVGNKHRELFTQLEAAQLKIEDINSKRSRLLSEISKVKQILEQEKNIFAGFPAALQQMDMKSLEEEYKALQGDKAVEIEYFHSLEETISGMKGISEPVKCCCGLE
ncbi:hypothetical protein SEVIR_6G121200v4 [Setaria viridis]|uniref:Uncharacterized protein n=1 Tax=Setaria viridis TaxID=4556 RepID=A0A4V6D5A9_SETVI|nr:uncharacterized protein LOC117860828 isoform X2 [Setaria viridis]TKW09726.1 hypothetical protein SEVIR_6G121200v2 [Setaria viridis]